MDEAFCGYGTVSYMVHDKDFCVPRFMTRFRARALLRVRAQLSTPTHAVLMVSRPRRVHLVDSRTKLCGCIRVPRTEREVGL